MRGLVVTVVVVGGANTEAVVMVSREERLATDNLAPETDQNGADDHTNDGNANTGDDANQDREDDVRGKLAEELRPAVLTSLGHVTRVVAVMRVRVAVTLAALESQHASATLRLELLQLGGDDGAPFADHGGALLAVLGRVIDVLRWGLFNLGDYELVLGVLDQANADVGQAIDKDGTDFNDLEVNDDKVQTIIGGCGGGLNL